MVRTPTIILIAALLTTPMALGSAGLLPTAQGTNDDTCTPEVPEDLKDDLAGALDGIQGVEFCRDENHATLVRVDVGDDAKKVGKWLPPLDGGVPAVNLAVLPTGEILYYSGVEAQDPDDQGVDELTFMWKNYPERAETRLAEISDGGFTTGGTPETVSHSALGYLDIFCSGTTVGADGQVFAPGATHWRTLDESVDDTESSNTFYTPLQGGTETQLFAPGTSAWAKGPDMAVERWYPSAIQLGDGDTLIASGIKTLFFPNTYNTLLEVFDPETDTLTSVEPTLRFADGVETGEVFPSPPEETGNDVVDGTHERIPNLPMYPRITTIPSGPNAGDVFFSTAGDLWGPFGWHPLQAVWSNMQTLELDTTTGTATWTVHDQSVFGARQLAPSVPLMLDHQDTDGDGVTYEMEVLTFGGTLQQGWLATATSEVADLSGASPTAAATGELNLPRWHTNGVLLPDGKVLAVGGSLFDNVVMHGAPDIAMMNAELYDPATGEWELVASMENPRAYHSTAVLLPDARVLVGGHVPLPAFHSHQRGQVHDDVPAMNPQPADTTFEIYEPAYLHAGTDRPVIASVQAQVNPTGGTPTGHYGEDITVTVSGLDQGVGDIDSVVLMRPGATTHGFDADQRGISLDFSTTTNNNGEVVATATLPAEGAVAPQGSYMLFVNEDHGEHAVPSQAVFLDLQPAPTP